MKKLILYTINGCSKCYLVNKYLKDNKIEYREVNISEQMGSYQEIIDLVGEVYAPVLVYGDSSYKINNIEQVKELFFR